METPFLCLSGLVDILVSASEGRGNFESAERARLEETSTL